VSVENHPEGGAVFRLSLARCLLAGPSASTGASAELAETG
jgi:hypothetical protein